MTCREKLKLEYPSLVNERFIGGCCGCPYHRGYAGKPKWSCEDKNACKRCWDREVEKSQSELMVKVGVALHNGFESGMNYAFNAIGKYKIRKVIFNDPATIILWTDGTKTVVKAENEPFDPEKGMAMAIAKKFLGNNHAYYDQFKRWIPKKK